MLVRSAVLKAGLQVKSNIQVSRDGPIGNEVNAAGRNWTLKKSQKKRMKEKWTFFPIFNIWKRKKILIGNINFPM